MRAGDHLSDPLRSPRRSPMPAAPLERLKEAWTASAGTLEPAYRQRVFSHRLSQMTCGYRMMRAGLLFPETEDGLAPFQRTWNPDRRYVQNRNPGRSGYSNTERAPSKPRRAAIGLGRPGTRASAAEAEDPQFWANAPAPAPDYSSIHNVAQQRQGARTTSTRNAPSQSRRQEVLAGPFVAALRAGCRSDRCARVQT